MATEYMHMALEKLKMTSSSRPPHGEQYSRIGRTNACYQRSNTEVSTKTCFTNLKIPILPETRKAKQFGVSTRGIVLRGIQKYAWDEYVHCVDVSDLTLTAPS